MYKVEKRGNWLHVYDEHGDEYIRIDHISQVQRLGDRYVCIYVGSQRNDYPCVNIDVLNEFLSGIMQAIQRPW